MWSKNQFSGSWFEIEVAMKVTGQGRVGADGMVCRAHKNRTHFVQQSVILFWVKRYLECN